MKNIFSIDLESWIYFFHEAARRPLGGGTSEERKQLDDRYLPGAVKEILSLLDTHGQKATFFVLGEIYDWYPELLRDIADRGHEIAYHTHSHTIITGPEVLEEQIGQSEEFIRHYRPKGFRAPRIHLTNDCMAILKKNNFVYSSSTYDRHEVLKLDGIDEIPVSALTYSGARPVSARLPKELSLAALTRKLPFGSGFFIPLLGRSTSHLIKRINEKGDPAVLFVHPWQIVQPEAIRGWKFKMQLLCQNPFHLPYTVNARGTVEHLFQNHKFVTFKEFYYDKYEKSAV